MQRDQLGDRDRRMTGKKAEDLNWIQLAQDRIITWSFCSEYNEFKFYRERNSLCL